MKYAGHGLALGALIGLLEFAYYYPLVPETGAASLLGSILLPWCGEGVLLGLTLALFERRAAPRPLRPAELAAAVVIGVALGVLAWQSFLQFVLRAHFGLWLLRDHMGQPVDPASIMLYNAWLMLIFGGLAVALHGARQRHARMLATLRGAELEREASARRLAETRLAALQARIAPDFLFQTLARLETLYEADPPAADRLLEDLIVFLRRAVEER